ncbi:MAG: zinc ribbon domain-containing protein [Actinobacteria bacterium]|nr:zinc ribbon domain-containing protein [Actinomycetota bacterium]
MPIYEYRCPQGHLFELFKRMSDPPPDGCEVCGEGPVQTVLYPVAVHFKGSGFYSTDYGRASSKGKDGKDGEDGKDGKDGGVSADGGAEKKESKETKPAEKKAAEAG